MRRFDVPMQGRIAAYLGIQPRSAADRPGLTLGSSGGPTRIRHRVVVPAGASWAGSDALHTEQARWLGLVAWLPPLYVRARQPSIVDEVEPRIRKLLQPGVSLRHDWPCRVGDRRTRCGWRWPVRGAFPTMPATVIAERVRWTRGSTVFSDPDGAGHRAAHLPHASHPRDLLDRPCPQPDATAGPPPSPPRSTPASSLARLRPGSRQGVNFRAATRGQFSRGGDTVPCPRGPDLAATRTWARFRTHPSDRFRRYRDE
jgi:hypothetical protein